MIFFFLEQGKVSVLLSQEQFIKPCTKVDDKSESLEKVIVDP